MISPTHTKITAVAETAVFDADARSRFPTKALFASASRSALALYVYAMDLALALAYCGRGAWCMVQGHCGCGGRQAFKYDTLTNSFVGHWVQKRESRSAGTERNSLHSLPAANHSFLAGEIS
jgi:hypothetical protein